MTNPAAMTISIGLLANAPLSWFLHRHLDNFIMTIKYCIIWTEFRPATAPVPTMSEKHISYTLKNLSAGQSWTIPAKTTCANQTSQFFVTGQIRSALITGLLHLKPFTKTLLV
jgi:hypothetical protein